MSDRRNKQIERDVALVLKDFDAHRERQYVRRGNMTARHLSKAGRVAWARLTRPPGGKWPKRVWFVHHAIPAEMVTSARAWRGRVIYILRDKDRGELVPRLIAMRPWRKAHRDLRAHLGHNSRVLWASAIGKLRQRALEDYPDVPLSPPGASVLRVEGTEDSW